MTIRKVVFDPSTFGITQKSLRMLRNALADNLHDEIMVMQIQTSDICCGFLVLNKSTGTATWSGDGFRTDRGGEGGRGFAAAKKLLDTFGVRCFESYEPETSMAFQTAINSYASESGMQQAFVTACSKAAREYPNDEFKCYYETSPWY